MQETATVFERCKDLGLLLGKGGESCIDTVFCTCVVSRAESPPN